MLFPCNISLWKQVNAYHTDTSSLFHWHKQCKLVWGWCILLYFSSCFLHLVESRTFSTKSISMCRHAYSLVLSETKYVCLIHSGKTNDWFTFNNSIALKVCSCWTKPAMNSKLYLSCPTPVNKLKKKIY